MYIHWQRKLIWGVKLGELTALLGIYLVFYLMYVITLTYNESAYVQMSLWDLFKNYLVSQGIDYSLKFLLTVPLWYLYFRALKQWTIFQKVLLHFLTGFLFVAVWKQSFYFMMEALGRGHLRGSSQVWDIYIPMLMYVIQFGFFHAYQYFTEVQKQKELEAQLRQATLQSELSAIKAQLNPHFLYNVFNTISASVPPEMENTREMIAELADMFRYQLRATKEDFVKLKDELDFTEKYLSLEKGRFGTRLRSVIEVENTLMNEKVPPLILQPIVENAIKHGISPKIEGGEVTIKIEKKETELVFTVSDTGVGMTAVKLPIGQGIGLTNTQLRLEKMFGKTIHYAPNTPTGMKFWFEIPSFEHINQDR